MHPEDSSSLNAAVVYDGDLAVYTPLNLWTSTGVSLSVEDSTFE
jgi:hypothetical protein